jgi:putative DNA primase/helicase
MNELENLLPRLVSRTQWMAWRRVERNGGKFSKQPINPHNGGAGKHNDPTTWGSLAEALALRADGIGFTLSGDDPFCILDIDGAIDEDGALTELAGRVLDRFRGAYVELSPSGRGLHIIIEGKLPGKGRNSQKLGLEVYDRLRFVTVTGECFGESGTVEPMQEALDWLLAEFWPETPKSEHKGVSQAAQGGRLIGDDGVLVEKALSSGQGAKFQSLWLGEWEAGGYGSHSDADLALCGALQFWTGGDAARIDRLFRQSGLMRGKWDEVHGAQTYGALTIERALAGSTGRYSGRKEPEVAPAAVVNTEKKERGRREAGALAKVERLTDRDNEAANAERLVEHHTHELRYVPGLGWFCWNGWYWEADELRARSLAAGVARYVEEEVLEQERLRARAPSEAAGKVYADRAKALRKWRRRCGFYPTVAGTLGLAADRLRLDAGALDRHDHLLNVENGTLDLKAGTLRAHNPGDFLTRMAPVRYELGAECSRWRLSVGEMVPDVDTRRELQKWLGYCLCGDISEHKIGFFYGWGANGKSTLLETFQRLLGADYAKRAVANLLMASGTDRHTTEKAMLMGSRVVLCSETDEGKRFSEQTFKELTDGEMTARLMRQDDVTFRIHFKVCLMANHKPRAKDATHSFWRRLLVFPFGVQFDRPNLALKEELAEELPGILNWCLEGYRMWTQEKMRETPAMAAMKGRYREEEDELGRFIEDYCTLGEGLTAQSATLYGVYRDVWCREQGIADREAMNNTAFKRAMEARGIQAKRRRGGITFIGLELGRTDV